MTVYGLCIVVVNNAAQISMIAIKDIWGVTNTHLSIDNDSFYSISFVAVSARDPGILCDKMHIISCSWSAMLI